MAVAYCEGGMEGEGDRGSEGKLMGMSCLHNPDPGSAAMRCPRAPGELFPARPPNKAGRSPGLPAVGTGHMGLTVLY